jgi:uncharacterized membrane protein
MVLVYINKNNSCGPLLIDFYYIIKKLWCSAGLEHTAIVPFSAATRRGSGSGGGGGFYINNRDPP